MNEQNNVVEILEDIKSLLTQNKTILNTNELIKHTGLSKSKIYDLISLKLIPVGNNKHLHKKYFSKKAIDAWLLGEPDLSDEFLEQKMNEQLLKNKKR